MWRLLVVDHGLLQLGVHQGVVGPLALLLARVVLGEEAREGVEGLLEPLIGLDVGGAGLIERRAGLGDLRLLLGLGLGLLAHEHRQVTALDEQAGQLHEGLGGQRMPGIRLGEGVELAAGLVEHLLAMDQVARLGRLIEQEAALLVVDGGAEVGRRARVLAESFQVLARQVEVAALAQSLDESQRVPGIFRPGGRRQPDQGRRQHGDDREGTARHDAILRGIGGPSHLRAVGPRPRFRADFPA